MLSPTVVVLGGSKSRHRWTAVGLRCHRAMAISVAIVAPAPLAKATATMNANASRG